MKKTPKRTLTAIAKALISFAKRHYLPEGNQESKLFSPSDKAPQRAHYKVDHSIDALFENRSIVPFPKKKNFNQMLFELMDQNDDFDEVAFYTHIHITRSNWSKLKSNDDMLPKKPTMFKLLIGFRLKIDEAETFLASAGYAFNHSDYFDLIIYSAIMNEIYDLDEIDTALEHYAKKTLFSLK